MADSVADAVASGDHRAALEALRDRLTVELEEAVGRDVAVITKEIRAVLTELSALPVAREASKVADLTARIAARRENASAV